MLGAASQDPKVVFWIARSEMRPGYLCPTLRGGFRSVALRLRLSAGLPLISTRDNAFIAKSAKTYKQFVYLLIFTSHTFPGMVGKAHG